jgi:uncharacterized protein (UPF0332 family)
VTEEGSKLLVKAAEAIAAARILLENGQANFAAGRAYYAMFYVAEALLVEGGLRSRSHSGVHALSASVSRRSAGWSRSTIGGCSPRSRPVSKATMASMPR